MSSFYWILWFFGTFLFGGLGLSGCGYRFQNSYNNLYLKEKIQTLYVAPISNNSDYTSELGVIVYNHLIRTLSAHQKITLLRQEKKADAILQGTIVRSFYSVAGSVRAVDLGPKTALSMALPEPERLVPSQYSAFLECSFRLMKGEKTVWSLILQRSQPFAASYQLGVPGNTSVLIHHGEFLQTVSELSKSMMEEVHESMLGVF